MGGAWIRLTTCRGPRLPEIIIFPFFKLQYFPEFKYIPFFKLQYFPEFKYIGNVIKIFFSGAVVLLRPGA